MDDEQILLSAARGRRVGPYSDVLEAPSFTDSSKAIKLGVPHEVFGIIESVGTIVAHYRYIVRPGLLQAKFLCRGMDRDMKVGDDKYAGAKVVSYVWRPNADYEWTGGRDSRAFPLRFDAPLGRVYVALARPFDKQDEHGVSGLLLRWNWIYGRIESFDCKHRYDDTIWRR